MTEVPLLFEIDAEDADKAEGLVEGKLENHSQRFLLATDGRDRLPRHRAGQVLR